MLLKGYTKLIKNSIVACLLGLSSVRVSNLGKRKKKIPGFLKYQNLYVDRIYEDRVSGNGVNRVSTSESLWNV